MSVSDVTEMWSRQSSSHSSSDGVTFRAKYSSAYQVLHAPGTSQDAIRNAPGIPVIRSGYQGNSHIQCTEVGRVQPIGPIMSIVPVQWEGEISKHGGLPTEQRAKWSIENVVSSEEADTDGAGYPLTNTIGEPVVGLQKEVWDWNLSLSQNFMSFNSYALQQYAHATNSDSFGPPGNIWPPGTARLQGGLKITPSDESPLGHFKVAANILFRSPLNTLPFRSWWWRYRNEGYYERTGTTVTFDPPLSGNPAAGYAITNSSGDITSIAVTNPGSGYIAAPGVTITSTTGGAGAAATASINGDRVSSVVVDAGGTSYRSKIERAVDDNKQPVTKPVLLDASGSRLENSDNAVFLERPRYKFYLPFSFLGFRF